MRSAEGGEIYVIGIESTAHTFGVGIVDGKGNAVADERSVYVPPPGEGIHPQLAAEHHSRSAVKVLRRALEKSGLDLKAIDGIAFSAGPGLGPALRIGATMARFLACYHSKPLYPVHHAIGHVELAIHLSGANDPLVVVVSGGHTSIMAFNMGRWRVYGETLDITLGNLLDQLGRELSLPFPGGPRVEALAKKGERLLELPYVVKGNNVSYSGLLTSALKLAERERVEDVCYSVQEVAFSMLVEVTERALVQLGKGEVLLTGGVASNGRLREMIRQMCEEHGAVFREVRDRRYNADNGVQIAIVGLRMHEIGASTPPEEAGIKQRWRVDEVDVPWRTRSGREKARAKKI